MKIKIGDLVILVDREHCQLLTLNQHTQKAHLLILSKFINEVAISHPIPRDGPGRTYNRAAGRKTAYEQINPRKIRDHHFFVDLDSKIKAEWESGGFDRVILVGEPEVLHELKEVLSPHLLQKVCCEINKNYINIPISNLEKILKTT
jgi:protein required for attachment to host cells